MEIFYIFFYEKAHTAYYYCSDTNCKGKGTYNFDIEKESEYNKKMKNTEIFVLSKEHTIEYNSHNYVINETAIKD